MRYTILLTISILLIVGCKQNTTGPNIPTEPILKSPASDTVGTDTTVLLKWDHSLHAIWYHVQVSSKADFSEDIVNLDGIDETQYPVFELERGVKYFWRVSCRSYDGGSGWSAVRNFTVVNARIGIEVTPYIEFDGECIGRNIDSYITVSNPAMSEANLVGSLSLYGNGFSLVGEPDFIIPPDSSAQFLIRFSPADTSMVSGFVIITHNATLKSNPLRTTFSGWGYRCN